MFLSSHALSISVVTHFGTSKDFFFVISLAPENRQISKQMYGGKKEKYLERGAQKRIVKEKKRDKRSKT